MWNFWVPEPVTKQYLGNVTSQLLINFLSKVFCYLLSVLFLDLLSSSLCNVNIDYKKYFGLATVIQVIPLFVFWHAWILFKCCKKTLKNSWLGNHIKTPFCRVTILYIIPYLYMVKKKCLRCLSFHLSFLPVVIKGSHSCWQNSRRMFISEHTFWAMESSVFLCCKEICLSARLERPGKFHLSDPKVALKSCFSSPERWKSLLLTCYYYNFRVTSD